MRVVQFENLFSNSRVGKEPAEHWTSANVVGEHLVAGGDQFSGAVPGAAQVSPERRHLSADALFSMVHTSFAKVPDLRIGGPAISLADALTSASIRCSRRIATSAQALKSHVLTAGGTLSGIAELQQTLSHSAGTWAINASEFANSASCRGNQAFPIDRQNGRLRESHMTGRL